MHELLDNILPRVTKPARYTGGEYNAVLKDHKSAAVKLALAFPDTYEIGMSNLGLRILYSLVNNRPDALAERVFAPWVDMESEMRRHGLPLFALESGTPVAEFDIIGFSLGYELTYTNVLNMLDLAGLAPLAGDRPDDAPLVIAGGCCIYNPEPMAPFVDAFVIGEGEEVLHEFIDAYKAHRSLGKRELLRKLAAIPGVYVPALYDVRYNDDGSIAAVTPNDEAAPARVTKRLVMDLDAAEYPETAVMPFIDTVHNRIPLEVMRGCSRGCRFCQAGMIYRPVRERSKERLMEMAEKLSDNTGYDEMALLSLSTADYTGIQDLVRDLTECYQDRKIGLSLPSIRADASCVELASEIQKVRKSGLTLAPEAGTQRMRDIIDKNVTEENLFAAVEAAFRFGWKRIKLYFMLGLPGETDEDLAGIARLSSAVADIGRRMRVRPTLNVSVSCFVPKPHTPFQWRAQDTIEELERKQDILKHSMRDRAVSLGWHDARTSHLEAVFARGDRRVGAAIYRAWRKGQRFDAWQEEFSHERWMEAFAEEGLDPAFYASRRRPYEEVLPWDHIDCGVSKAFLIREDKRADDAQVTPDCRMEDGQCSGCGVLRILPAADEVSDVPCYHKA